MAIRGAWDNAYISGNCFINEYADFIITINGPLAYTIARVGSGTYP